MLMGVTISGVKAADVERCGLNQLTKKYPFVEWAHLHARVEDDRARYCSEAELVGLNVHAELDDPFAGGARALHLCGDASRAVLAKHLVLDHIRLLTRLDSRPSRLQLNWDVATLRIAVDSVPRSRWIDALWKLNVTPVLQVYDANTQSWVEELFTILNESEEDPTAIPQGLQVLFDASRGKGMPMDAKFIADRAGAFVESVVPSYWRKRHLVVGFAGGIRPDNVEEIVGTLGERFKYPFWIDMESGVRNDRDELDRDRIETVLERASGFLPMAPPLSMTGLPPAWARFWGCEDRPKAPPPAPEITVSADATEAELAWAASPMAEALASRSNAPGVLTELRALLGVATTSEVVPAVRQILGERTKSAALDERLDALEERVGTLASLTAALSKAVRL